MSEAKRKILQLLADGKITVEESEELLAAIETDKNQDFAENTDKNNFATEDFDVTDADYKRTGDDNDWVSAEFKYDEKKSRKKEKKSIFSDAGKISFDIKNLAHTIQTTVEQAIKKAEPKSRELRKRMKEFGDWMHDVVGSIAEEVSSLSGEIPNAIPVNFCVHNLHKTETVRMLTVENPFGEIRIRSGKSFKIDVSGKVSKNTLGEYNGQTWFANNAINVVNDNLIISFDKSKKIRAFLDYEITVPEGITLCLTSVSSDIRIKGKFKVENLKTVSGNIFIYMANVNEAEIESVSGNVQISDCSVSGQLKTTSGDFLLRNIKIGCMKINSLSGNILVTDSEVFENSKVLFSTTSGDIIVEKIAGPWSLIEADSKVGNVTLEWTGNATPLNNENTVIKTGEPGAEFKAESVSGDIQFIKAGGDNE